MHSTLCRRKTRVMVINNQQSQYKSHSIVCPEPICRIVPTAVSIEIVGTLKLLGILFDDGVTLVPLSNSLVTALNHHCLSWREWWAANKEGIPVKIGLWAFESVVRSRSELGIGLLHENSSAMKKVFELIRDTMTALLGLRWYRVVKCSVAYELGQQDSTEKHKTRNASSMISPSQPRRLSSDPSNFGILLKLLW
jgi:hypothetical protein